jgi:hypothetical protein
MASELIKSLQSLMAPKPAQQRPEQPKFEIKKTQQMRLDGPGLRKPDASEKRLDELENAVFRSGGLMF